ncbi:MULTISPECIES: glucose-1-phosphate cytidylyltransferase [unclassified Mesorhizobium]|uniref:glucose-1-phosphate cytidylyltransferase n=1 Tax=unclassified Mesorhizobium TaxID=325217 RepID=UPI000F758D2F|nr:MULTISPECIES: glucose-1-phosphate cytidylyltransferase [unclassified Mesorhizobium]AZO70860.1 glucose-1-phosphate cytidylyltransferase [Mesorhizobium sp. M1D.F.Ca.ET.043.01.1.1]RWA82304.1 MAG: glucose-1-phosphate cytidylyltransferase [Mesorhizobium sp.]RWD60508.1 MAG: glucose-1-phosphate cytidylyltransferase [Mesorhizobium sp.]RWE09800.1 MAG: glucose-1-phosphate cytidylyltransferase [Mesorhizobium sp.]RWE50411.1 MAG: glucose-1-phosphate cytidylyltransferase [Mesorhizobium sp.]
MKAVILAGGLGTRLAEETSIRPKPLVEIGGRPILWHIMKCYSAHGINEFVVCCGYKGYMIKEYFANYFLHMCDVTFDIANNQMTTHQSRAEDWKVTLIDTGDETMTGGRLRRVRQFIGEETFCFTYGDGVGDVDITATVEFHRRHGKLATLTAATPPGRFGALNLDGHDVRSFQEKPKADGGVINAGFFVLEPQVIDRISGDATVWEREPLETLASDGQLAAWRHEGFWQPMDTLRDRNQLEALWASGKAPWRVWQ